MGTSCGPATPKRLVSDKLASARDSLVKAGISTIQPTLQPNFSLKSLTGAGKEEVRKRGAKPCLRAVSGLQFEVGGLGWTAWGFGLMALGLGFGAKSLRLIMVDE